MTVRLKVQYGKFPPNTLLTTGIAEETRLLNASMADTNLAAGVEYAPVAEDKWQTPVSLRISGGADQLVADRRVVGGAATTSGASYAATLPLSSTDPTTTQAAIAAAANRAQARWVNAADYGFATGNTAAANTTAFNAASALAIAADVEMYMPAGTFNVSPGLQWNSPYVRLAGSGSRSTILRFSGNGSTGLRVGTGTAPDDLGAQGWLRDFRIDCAVAAPASPGSGVAALLLNSVKFADVANIYIGGFDVGLDMINNNYGTSFRNVHSRYGTCNLALRLRSATQSGNDFQFLNCWLAGKYRTVSVEPDTTSGADGFHFLQGQISGGQGLATGTDTMGCVTVSSNWQSGVNEGEGSRIIFTGTTFEGFHRMWGIRIFQPVVGLVLRDVQVTSTSGSGDADAPYGFLKHSNPYNDHIELHKVSYSGGYSTALISLTPDGGGANPTYIEIGTHGFPNVAGATLNLFQRGVFDLMGLSRGISLAGGAKSILMLDGLRLRNNAGVLQSSTNGTTWANV